MLNKIIRLILLCILVVLPYANNAKGDVIPEYTIKFNPTGTHIQHGQLKIRLDFYPNNQCKTYNQQHINIVDESSTEWLLGYQGKVDKDSIPIDILDYQNWIDSLPHIWVTNPALSLFVSVNELIYEQQLRDFINSTFTTDTLVTLDNILTLSNSSHLVSSYLRDKATLSKSQSVVDVQTINDRLANFTTIKSANGISQSIRTDSIDVGAGAVNRASYYYVWQNSSSRNTVVDLNNPANATGTIDTIESWWSRADSGNIIRFGTFYYSGTTVTCRDGETAGQMSSGSKQTTAGLSLDIEINDVIGTDFDSATSIIQIERDTEGFNGFARRSGVTDCDPTDTGTYDFTNSDDAVSLFGIGTETEIEPVIKFIQKIFIW